MSPRWVFCLASFLMTTALVSAQQPRVFVTDSKSWEMRGTAGGNWSGWGGTTSGGARPQTAETIKTFQERCTEVRINNRPEKADYVVVLEHEGGKGWGQKDNKIAVFNSEGDLVFSSSTVTLGGAVQGACVAISSDWGRHPRATPEVTPPEAGTEANTVTGGLSKQPDSALPVDIATVALVMRRTPKHEKYSKPQVAFAVVDDVFEYLKTKNVSVAKSDASARYQLRLIIDRPITKWIDVRVQAFDSTGKLLWEDSASSGGGVTGDHGLRVALEKIHAMLDKKLGEQNGLPVGATD